MKGVLGKRCVFALLLVLSCGSVCGAPGSQFDPSMEKALLAGDWSLIKASIDAHDGKLRGPCERCLLHLARYALADSEMSLDLVRAITNEPSEARAEFLIWASAFADQNAESATAKIVKGVALRVGGQLEPSLECFREASVLDDKCVLAHVLTGQALSVAGLPSEAVLRLKKALSLAPRYPSALAERAQALAQLGEYENAISDMDKAVKACPNCAILYRNRATINFLCGKNKESMRDINHALELAPKWVDCLLCRAELYALQGLNDQAIQDADSAINLAPHDVAVYTSRAAVYEGLGDLDQAKSDYEEAVRADPLGPRGSEARAKLTAVVRKASWPPDSPAGLLSVRSCKETGIPKSNRYRLKNAPWVVRKSLRVEDAKSGEVFRAAARPRPDRGEYRYLDPGILSFALADAGREVTVTYDYQCPKVAILTPYTEIVSPKGGGKVRVTGLLRKSKSKGNAGQSDPPLDVAETTEPTVEEYFKTLGCELVDKRVCDSAAVQCGLDLAIPSVDPAKISAFAQSVDAALVILSSVSAELREETHKLGKYEFDPGQWIPTPVGPIWMASEERTVTYWVSSANICALDATGATFRTSEGAASLVHPWASRLYRGKVRRACVRGSVDAALEGLRLRAQP